MSLLDLFRKSKLRINTPDGIKPGTYQESAIQARNVRFPANVAPEATFDSYIKVGSGGTLPIPSAPVTYYLTTEDEQFLITENDNDLIADQE